MKEIIFVAIHPCIRVLKEAKVLKDLGYKLHLIFGDTVFGPLTADNAKKCAFFENIQFFTDEHQLEIAIKNAAKHSKVFHVHNEPNWPVIKVREIVPDATIIFDVHDSMYWRQEDNYHEEDIAVDCADLFVVPSETCKKELATRTDKDIIFIPSAVPLSWYQVPGFSRGGIGSQGGHVLPDSKVSWRDYTDLYTELISKEKSVYAYSAQFKQEQTSKREFDIAQHYGRLGAQLGNVEYEFLLELIGAHDWNLVGIWRANENVHKVWSYALPNKLYDAIAAGTPSVSFNCQEAEKIIEEYDIGVVCKTPTEFIERWDEHKEKRKNLMLIRKELALENFISPLVELYESL